MLYSSYGGGFCGPRIGKRKSTSIIASYASWNEIAQQELFGHSPEFVVAFVLCLICSLYILRV